MHKMLFFSVRPFGNSEATKNEIALEREAEIYNVDFLGDENSGYQGKIHEFTNKVVHENLVDCFHQVLDILSSKGAIINFGIIKTDNDSK